MMNRKIPAFVMWYLLVIDHLKCVFSNPRDAKLMRWHFEKHRENDEEIQQPALSTEGMNPFGENKTVHNTWPVILMMYNIRT
jgi:hypothetical protein